MTFSSDRFDSVVYSKKQESTAYFTVREFRDQILIFAYLTVKLETIVRNLRLDFYSIGTFFVWLFCVPSKEIKHTKRVLSLVQRVQVFFAFIWHLRYAVCTMKPQKERQKERKNSHVIILFLFYSVLLGIIQSFNNTNAYKNINSTEKKQNENL